MITRPILVVDDEPEMRMAVYESLTRSGYNVATAIDGKDAIEKIYSYDFGMVITDMKMPGMDGMNLLRELKRRTLKIPVVMITAYGTIDMAVNAMKLGAYDYVIKPFKYETLEDVIKRALGATGEVPVKTCSKEREFITADPQMLKLLSMVKIIASSPSTILIQGESGTGKEVAARFVHKMSNRANGPFVAVNCAALPEGLLESELFGFEKGAFTGANTRRVGKFELANGGTLLLDEISEMSLSLQAKLLRVIQEREVDRIGGRLPVPLDIRIVATTNRSLKNEVERGTFREDLYYRLNVFPIFLPPLRERKGDIPLLADFFVKKFSLMMGKNCMRISKDAENYLQAMEWKGNIREFENYIERVVILKDGMEITAKDLIDDITEIGRPVRISRFDKLTTGRDDKQSMHEMEKDFILKTLDNTGGNRTHAAKILGISIRTLRNRLKEYKIPEGGKNLPIH
ncbi:MAG: sigma-54-dependent Fis family transcriptional regulator [Nitrospirae bacterium]|nr:sigma-54-dependent Fis family transcriptional regulator [Nitrospirota bacterium]